MDAIKFTGKKEEVNMRITKVTDVINKTEDEKNKKEISIVIKKLEEKADNKLMEFINKSFAPALKLLENFKLSYRGLQFLKNSNLTNMSEIIRIIFIEDIVEQKRTEYREKEIKSFLDEHEKMIKYLKELEK